MKRSELKELLRKSMNEVLLENRCWKGYEPVPGKEPYSKGSCRKKQEIGESESLGECDCGPDCECGGNCGSNCKCKGCSGNLEEIADKDMKKIKGFRVGKKIQRLHDIIKDDLLELVGSDREAFETMHYIKKIRQGFGASGQDELVVKLLKQIADEEPEVAGLMKRTFGDQLSEGGQCTKPNTQKTSSTRKDKKWMKCSNGKRIHWGDPNAKVTGKSGNTKRKKNFRARHNCSSAKPGTPRHAACQDW